MTREIVIFEDSDKSTKEGYSVMKSIKKNYCYNLFYQILSVLIPLITAPYLSRVLGPEGIGAYSYTTSIVTYFTLFAAMGVSLYGQREVSYCQDNKERRTRVFWETKLLNFVSTGICFMIYLLLAIHSVKYRQLYLVLSINIITVALNITWLFQGMEEFGKVVFRNTLFKIINVVFVFTCIHDKNDLLFYALGTAAFSLLGEGSLWIGLPRLIGKPNWEILHPFRDLKTIISLFIPTIAISIYTVLDKTMLGLLIGNIAENGFYEQASKLSKVSLMFVTSLGTVMAPRVGHYVENHETANIKDAMYRSYRFVWFLGIPLCLGLLGISENLVPWFFGQGYDKVIPLVRILAWLVLAIGISNATGLQYLIPTKRQHVFTLTVSLGALVNFICNWILIPKWASIGAAVGSIIAETCVTFSQLIMVRKELSLKKVFVSSTHYWIAGIVMYLILLFEKGSFDASPVHTLIMILSGGLSYVLVLSLLHDIYVKGIIQFIAHIMKREKIE